jgi:hypothetical protein
MQLKIDKIADVIYLKVCPLYRPTRFVGVPQATGIMKKVKVQIPTLAGEFSMSY